MTRVSLGIISAILSMLTAIEKHKIHSKQALFSYLRITYADLEHAMELAAKCSWLVSSEKTTFFLTERGQEIIDIFDGKELTKNVLHKMLRDYAILCSPIWVFRVPSGRKEASLFMSIDERRCFFEAGLIETTIDSKCIKWWDALSAEVQSTRDMRLLETGRKAEQLTLQYEEQRTGVTPDWRSFDTNLAGYDVLSVMDKNDDAKLLIEVKASTLPLPNASLIITSHEWEIALQARNYRFYLWALQKYPCLGILSVDDLRPHIPQNMGHGVWKKAQVPFIEFQERFVPYSSVGI